MSKVINKAAVLGAGVMGAGIAGLLASTGVQVSLLDIVPPMGLSDQEKAKGLTEESPAFRNKFVNGGLKNITNPKMGMLYSKDKAKNIRVGNLTDNLDYLEDADWIIEVVVERLDVKKGVIKTISEHAKKDAIISTNTSGVSITKIVEDMDDDFKTRFLGTHFFNPPRYMGLFEMIPTQWTSKATIDFMADFAANRLGKTVVYAKDTPNFIGNRIGCYSYVYTMHTAQKYGYDFPTVDVLTGPVMGHPKSATFKTGDMVGVDILANVSKNVVSVSKNEKEIAEYTVPDYINDLLAAGALGDKAKHGFYKKDIVDGKKVTFAYDPASKEYKPAQAQKFESVAAALKSGNKYEAMAYGETEECKFYWECLKAILLYSASLVPEIADDFREIDKAMTAGYNWEKGPFQTWDAIGLKRSVEKMKAEGEEIPAWVLELVAAGKDKFYDGAANADGFIVLKNCTVLKENSDAILRDMGDGVLDFETRSKGNAITIPVAELLIEACDMLKEDAWNGMVLGNNGKNFSAGADLAEILKTAQAQNWDGIWRLINLLQSSMQAVKYAAKPVVAAPFGAAYGGGCEMTMQATSAVPFIETYMGLVESSLGLIPSGGGCTELTLRAMARCYDTKKISTLNAIRDVWANIMNGKVCSSAHDAIFSGYLNNNTYVEMRREKLLDSAKKEVLILAERGYHPKAPETIVVTGDFGYGSIINDIVFKHGGNYFSDHDVVVAKHIAHVITGGDLPYGAEIPATQMLELEGEAFVSLCGEKKTQDRIYSMLTTGRSIRN